MKRKSLFYSIVALSVLAVGFGGSSQVQTADAADSGQTAAYLQPAASLAYADFAVVVNGKPLQLDEPPRLVGDTMLVPLRNIAEALGAEVAYEETSGTVRAVKGDLSVKLQLGSTAAEKNGAPLTLAVAPYINKDTTMVPLRFFSEAFETAVKWDERNRLVAIDHESYLLPVVGSQAKLAELVQQSGSSGSYALTDTLMIRSGPPLMVQNQSNVAKSRDSVASAPVAEAGSASAEAKTSSSDFSTTNVQVQGVDEADVVKTDGEYIYQVNRDRIVIAHAYPAGELSLVSSLSLAEAKLQPLEIYVDGDKLTVIGQSTEASGGTPEKLPQVMPANPAEAGTPAVNNSSAAKAAASNISVEQKRMIWHPQQTVLKTMVYDIADRSKPRLLKELTTDGNYVTSRKIGSQVYVIANQGIHRYSLNGEQPELTAPSYRDSAVSDKWVQSDYNSIRYFPDSVLSTYMIIAGIDTEQPAKPANVSTYLGSAEQVYASLNNLYMSTTQYKQSVSVQPTAKDSDPSAPVVSQEVAVSSTEVTTTLYKFLLEDGKVRFSATGQVPGTLLNQFAMDEQNGYLRVATTKGDMWRNDDFTSKNNLYVLDESMNLTGQLEDIAPGEKIYSVRFMGNRGYMVTFKKVDPLFVLDLSNPAQPAILGKLKIPGYSDYLHPYDENHLIGFGKDAVEVANEWAAPGNSASSTIAYYQGMKVSLFDVTDVANPKELFQTVIGDRGTDSELLRNHKALLFSKEKGLLAFPVTVTKLAASAKQQGASAYGQFAFQGAYVYKVNLEEGFQLRGTITHLPENALQKAGDSWYDSSNNIDRLLYIGDTLYTLSPGEIRANDLATLAEKKRLLLD